MLFVDEIHRMPRPVEEVLYPALEDFNARRGAGQGPDRAEDPAGAAAVHAGRRPRRVRGASRCRCASGSGSRRGSTTTRWTTSRGSCGRSAGILGVRLDDEGADEIAGRSRGTPRIANRLLRRVRDFAEVRHDGAIDGAVARGGLELFEVDERGPRPARPRDPAGDRGEVRRWTGGPVDARGRRRRGARHGRGRRGALPAAARVPAPHASWAGGHRARVPPPRRHALRAPCPL